MYIANQNHIDATCNQEKKWFVQDRDDTVAAFGQPVPLGDVNRDHSTNTKNRLTKVMGSRGSVFSFFRWKSRLQICPLHIFGNKATDGTYGSIYWWNQGLAAWFRAKSTTLEICRENCFSFLFCEIWYKKSTRNHLRWTSYSWILYPKSLGFGKKITIC